MKKRVNIVCGTLALSMLVGGVASYTNVKAASTKASNIITVGKDADTISDAIDMAEDGTTIIVPKGVYKEQIAIDEEHNGITILGEDGAILDGSSIKPTEEDYSMIYIQSANVSIENLDIQGFKLNGPSEDIAPVGITVDEGSSNICISHCKVHDLGCVYTDESDEYNAHGIIVQGMPESPIEDVTIENCSIYNLTLGNSEAVAINGNVDTFTVKNNYVYNCDNIGIDAIGFEQTDEDDTANARELDRARNGVISNNKVDRISSANNITYRNDEGGIDACAGGIYVDGGKDTTVCDNYVSNCDIGIEVATEHLNTTVSGVKVYNNTLVNNNALAGISVGGCSPKENGAAVDCEIKNNTIYNTAGACFQFQFAKDSTNIVTKNIFIAEDDADVYYEACGEYSQGNTVKDNMANDEMPYENNIEFDLVDFEDNFDNNSISVVTSTDLSGYGSDDTLVAIIDEDED